MGQRKTAAGNCLLGKGRCSGLCGKLHSGQFELRKQFSQLSERMFSEKYAPQSLKSNVLTQKGRIAPPLELLCFRTAAYSAALARVRSDMIVISSPEISDCSRPKAMLAAMKPIFEPQS